MSTNGQGGGFFSRWSRQKAAEREAVKPSDKTGALAEEPVGAKQPAAVAPSVAAGTSASATPAKPPLPDVEQLTPQSDYTAFMAPDVAPELRSRALKKLFTDPHFNVMDGLDTYIDDYGKPDPIPESWYGRMNRIAGDMRPEPEVEEGGAAAAQIQATAQASQAAATSLDSAPDAPPLPPTDSPDASTVDGTEVPNVLSAPNMPTAPDALVSADTTKPIQAHE
ncbi:MAG: DUF3306 domain-containing protein [Burkholderiales bacterium]